MATDVTDGFGVVGYPPEIVAARHGREGAVEGQDFQAVAREVELPDDFRAKQRDHIGTFGEKKPGNDFFGDGGAAENVAAFEHDDLLPRFGKIRGVDQAVVASANDDNVVVLTHPV